MIFPLRNRPFSIVFECRVFALCTGISANNIQENWKCFFFYMSRSFFLSGIMKIVDYNFKSSSNRKQTFQGFQSFISFHLFLIWIPSRKWKSSNSTYVHESLCVCVCSALLTLRWDKMELWRIPWKRKMKKKHTHTKIPKPTTKTATATRREQQTTTIEWLTTMWYFKYCWLLAYSKRTGTADSRKYNIWCVCAVVSRRYSFSSSDKTPSI